MSVVVLYTYWSALAVVGLIRRLFGGGWRLWTRAFPPLADPDLSDRNTFRIVVARREAVADPAELCVPLSRILEACGRESRRRFRLHGYFPGRGPLRVWSRESVRDALAAARLDDHCGRPPDEPTHRVELYTCERRPEVVTLTLEFVTAGVTTTRSGLTLELRLTSQAAGRTESERVARVNRLLGHIVRALNSDHSAVLGPGEDTPEWWRRAAG